MTRGVLVFMVGLTILAVACGSAEARPLDAAAQGIAEDLDALRLVAGLAEVHVDSVSCYWSAASVRDSVEKAGMAFFDRVNLHTVLGRFVPDLEKRCFVVLAASDAELPAALREVPGYMEAALDSLSSHVAVAAGPTTDGRVWGSACLVHRLVELGPSIGTLTPDGPSSVTVQGTTGFAEVMLRAHRTDEGAIGDQVESPSVVVSSDESGAFSATLWFPARGPAHYDVVVLVRGGHGDEFRPAAKVGHFASKPIEHDCRASVTPFEGDN